MKNSKKHRYHYTWWLIQNIPNKWSLTESSDIIVLDVSILEEFYQKYPSYFTSIKWKTLCFQSLFFDKMDVFSYIWEKCGQQIAQQEIKHISSKSNLSYYPVTCTFFYLGKYDLIIKYYKKQPKDFSEYFWQESLRSLYYDFYHYFGKSCQKSTEQLIFLDKRLRNDFHDVFLIDLVDDKNLWWMVIIINDKDLFLYHTLLIKEKTTSFLGQCCSDIVSAFSDNLFFYVCDNWEILDNKGQFLRLKYAYRNKHLFDLIFDFVQNQQDDVISRHFIYKFLKNTSVETFEHGISRMKQLAVKTPLLYFDDKIISTEHFNFLIEMKTDCPWTKVRFANCETALHVLQHIKKHNFELSDYELNSLELEVFINLMKRPNKPLFDFWLENYMKRDSEIDHLSFLMNAEVCDKQFLDDEKFKNNAKHLDHYLQHFVMDRQILKEYVSLFENINSLNLVNHFTVFKKHGLLQDLLKMGDMNWMISINPGIKLWLKINNNFNPKVEIQC
jgi:hypothetical protein